MAVSNIWVFLELEEDHFEESSLEILGEARKIADRFGHKVTGVMLGSEDHGLCNSAISFGADNVVFLKHENLGEYGTETYTKALFDLVGKLKPDSFLVGSTRNGKDLAARLAARLRTGLAANVVSLDSDAEGTIFSGVPGYGSKVIARIVCVKNKPQMSTIRPGIFRKPEENSNRTGHIETIEPDLEGIENGVSVISRITNDARDITISDRVVVAGNGVKDEVGLVERFAEALHADIGATRPMADRGLFPREVQVGSTGVSLKSDLAIILGSSGSEHFVTGISNCKKVISIDNDENSGIFDYSDYCVVGDASAILREVLNRLEVMQK